MEIPGLGGLEIRGLGGLEVRGLGGLKLRGLGGLIIRALGVLDFAGLLYSIRAYFGYKNPSEGMDNLSGTCLSLGFAR